MELIKGSDPLIAPGTLLARLRGRTERDEERRQAVAINRMPVDPDVGIPDLLRQLGNDSKRLFSDEVKLAKLEMHESISLGARGATWLAVAFGVSVVALVAFTIFLSTLLGRLMAGHMWFGVLITGVAELIVAVLLLKRGMAALTEPSYSMEQTRESVAESTHWVARLH
jgi:hypothetical protein